MLNAYRTDHPSIILINSQGLDLSSEHEKIYNYEVVEKSETNKKYKGGVMAVKGGIKLAPILFLYKSFLAIKV